MNPPFLDQIIRKWQKRNISCLYCRDKVEAKDKILAMIPAQASVGISGSKTLDQLQLVEHLEARGNEVFNQFRPGLDRQQSMELRNKGATAEYFLSSANAISEKGELVFFSAYGHRIAGIANAKNVIIVSGVNKIVPDLNSCLKRAREYATVLNCKRLEFNTPCFQDGLCRNDICLFPEYKRMCCQVLILEAEISPDRLKVILVDEDLGF
jgi:hypothetical protein